MTITPAAPQSLPLAISIGEPAGIGPDIILKLWHEHSTHDQSALPKFFVLADIKHLNSRAQVLGLDLQLQVCGPDTDWRSFPTNTLPVWPLKNTMTAKPSKPEVGDGKAVVEAITEAVSCVRNGHASGVVTLPINKKSLYDCGFSYPGHTEYLGALAESWNKSPVRPVMMLAGPALRAVPVTIHIPLAEVASALTTKDIIETARITAHDLTRRFGIENPRLAISGLNPHAGESGALGHEDEAVIVPAIKALQDEGISCFGPLPADTMFHAAARQGYDAALCMYHDQALIPAKALAFDETVNVTLGLPFVRTSPDHGTAFDIAGTGKANTASTLAAIELAAQMAERQAAQPEKAKP